MALSAQQDRQRSERYRKPVRVSAGTTEHPSAGSRKPGEAAHRAEKVRHRTRGHTRAGRPGGSACSCSGPTDVTTGTTGEGNEAGHKPRPVLKDEGRHRAPGGGNSCEPPT